MKQLHWLNVPRRYLLITLIGGVILSTVSCTVGSRQDTRLGVPYRAQDFNSFDCGPASVLMWRLYHGLPEISQQTIGDFMGGTSCGGVTASSIAQAVNRYTLTSDAFWDLGSQFDTSSFLSRQITSIDVGIPVIGLIEGGLHAGVVNGGKWHTNANGDRQWDYVYFHDPLAFENVYYVADSWIATICPDACGQVISSSAVAGASANLSTYGSSIVIGGGGGSNGSPKPY